MLSNLMWNIDKDDARTETTRCFSLFLKIQSNLEAKPLQIASIYRLSLFRCLLSCEPWSKLSFITNRTSSAQLLYLLQECCPINCYRNSNIYYCSYIWQAVYWANSWIFFSSSNWNFVNKHLGQQYAVMCNSIISRAWGISLVSASADSTRWKYNIDLC